MTWNAQIAIKCNGKINQAHWNEVKKWPEVNKVWSSMGDWDYWLSLNNQVKNTEDLEKFVMKLRTEPWVDATSTRWWKEV